MAQKKFWSDLIFVQGINVLIKTIWILVIDRSVQNLLPAEDYGTYYRLLSLSILFVIVLDLGLNNMNSKEVSQNPGYFKTNFKSFISTKVLLSLGYSLLLFIAATLLGATSTQLLLLGGLAIFQTINSFNQYLRSNLAAMHLFKLDGLLAVADRLFVILVCGSWLLLPQYNDYLTVQNFVFVQVAGVCITWVVAFGINLIKHKSIEADRTLSRVNFGGLIKASLPYAVLITLMAIFTWWMRL